MLQLVDEASGKLLRQQHGDENHPNAVMMKKVLEARKRLPALANRLRHDVNVKTVDKHLAYDVAEVLDLMAWEPK